MEGRSHRGVGWGPTGVGSKKMGKSIFEAFFDVFGSFWALLGPFRSRFEVILGHFGPFWFFVHFYEGVHDF